MSINVGSNFLYQGTKFLDDRQNKINSLEDLKTWEIPIPDGFEVYVDNSWYIFNSTNTFDDITGKFRKRTTDISQEFGTGTDKVISQAVITERFNELDNRLNKLFASVFPLEFKSITGGGSFEVGNKVKPNIETSITQKIIDYIKINCMKNINAKDIAVAFSFNYDYLRRMFKEKIGISLKEFISKEQLHYAIDLLKNTSFTIKEVSELAGFSSPSHFAIIFKEEMKMTPREYVNKYLSSNSHQEIADFGGNQILFMED